VRARVFTGVVFEKRFGYCRALRVGQHVYVCGTAPIAPDGTTFAPGDAYAQTRKCIEIATTALRELGASPADVVRTRMYVTDISRAEEYGRAHGEAFGAAPPVTAMVEVRALIAPDMLVEIEVDALLD
jgi:enamine deaminase RidA (YjgF/YER057c/UK114 family)